MNITLIGSGARDNRMMSGFKGVIPWENLYIYRDFLLRHITGKTVIVSLETFENPFFKHLLTIANSRVLIITSEKVRDEQNGLWIYCSPRSALVYIKKNRPAQVTILTGSHMCKSNLRHISEVYYMQVDMLVRDGIDQFPVPKDCGFQMVSKIPFRIEKPDALFIRNRCDASFVVPVEIQHWLPKKSHRT